MADKDRTNRIEQIFDTNLDELSTADLLESAAEHRAPSHLEDPTEQLDDPVAIEPDWRTFG